MGIRSTDILDWRERDKRSMVVMTRLLFPVLLLTALAGRVFSRNPGNERRRGMSVVAEATDLTHSIVPWFYVFR